tara:strand:- start:372 stop:1088 length:717 start_codon:yes stop_codon:yes gene_type:complete
MSSNKKRAASWMNNALFEYNESKYVDFKVWETTLKDEFLEIAIRKTYSRYGHEQNLSKRSWRNLRSGIKVLYAFDICDEQFPRARRAYKIKTGEAKQTFTETDSDDDNMTIGEMIRTGPKMEVCKEIDSRKRQFGDVVENSEQNLQRNVPSESNVTIEKTLPAIEYKLISFSPEKMSKVEKYSFRDCLDDDDLTALKARFEKALEMPEFSMFMEKMDACDFASAMLHTRSKFISMYDW